MEERRFTEEMNKDEWEVLAEEKQNVNQYDNYSATLYRDNGSEKIYLYEDLMNEYNLYELEDEDIPKDGDYKNSLYGFVGNWISNENDLALECYRWGHSNPSEDVVGEDFEGDCKVLVVGCYAGYEPINWATCEHRMETLIFGSAREAQEWIDKQEEGLYYLANNEMGRPDYYIIADK